MGRGRGDRPRRRRHLDRPDAPGRRRVRGDAAARQGLHVEEAEVKSRFRRYFRNDEVDEQLGPMVTDEGIEYRRWRRIVANVLPDLPDLDRGFDELWDHFGRPESWTCFPDVARGLHALRDLGLPVRIASNFDGRLRAVARGLADLDGFVDTLVISAEVGHRKPSPHFYQAACASLDLPPDRVLCVGDDPENDVRGPERAGLRGLLLDRDDRRPSDIPHLPDLHALADLPRRGPGQASEVGRIRSSPIEFRDARRRVAIVSTIFPSTSRKGGCPLRTWAFKVIIDFHLKAVIHRGIGLRPSRPGIFGIWQLLPVSDSWREIFDRVGEASRRALPQGETRQIGETEWSDRGGIVR